MNNFNYILLIITNLPYYCYIYYNKYFILISFISTLHHLSPYLSISEKLQLIILKSDIFMSIYILIYVIIKNNMINLIKYLYVPILFLLAQYNIINKNYNYYTFYHCIWHFASAHAIINLT